MAKKEEMPVLEQKPGRYWGVIGRQHLPLGTGEAREAPFLLPGQPRKSEIDNPKSSLRCLPSTPTVSSVTLQEGGHLD
jgi:hypothetical protein